MNRKGFTLIELIATIALLAIIAVISFVSINKVIQKNKIENCKSLVSSIVTAATEYASDSRYNDEFVNNRIADYKLDIYASELLENEYLKGEIIDPYDKRNIINPTEVAIHIDFNTDYTVRNVIVNSPQILKECNVEPKEGVNIPDNPTHIDDGSDRTPPVISYSLSSGTYKGFQQLTVTVTDSESGIDYMVVEVYEDNKLVSAKSATKITASSYQVTLDSYHEWKVLTKAYDKAGNKSNQMPQTDDGRYYQEYEITGKPIYIYYHQNGGVISGKCAVGDSSSNTCSAYDGWAANGTTLAYQICRVDTTCNLWNYNNANYLNITRSGYGTKNNQEWIADRTETIFSHNTDYTYEELKAAIYQEKDFNYELKLRVNWKEKATITCANKDYNGSSQTIASCSGGTINNNSQTNAGNYTITCVGTGEYVDADSKTCKINKVDVICPTISGYSGTYDGNSHTITVSGGSGGTIQYRTSSTGSWSNEKPSRTSAGETTVYVQVAGDGNHNTKGCGSKNITISDAFSANTGSGACGKTFSVCNGKSLTCRGSWNGWTNENCSNKDGRKNYHKCNLSCSYTCNGKTTEISGDYQPDGVTATSCCTYASKSACTGSDPNGTWSCSLNAYGCYVHSGSAPSCNSGYHVYGSTCVKNSSSSGGSGGSGSSGGGGGGGCFLAGTKVTTPKGYVDINKLKIGDMVLSYNEETGENEFHEVAYVFEHKPGELNEELYTLTFDDKNTLKITSTHRLYIQNNDGYEWLATKYVKKGDYVRYADGTYHKITKIKHKKLTKAVYNISVDNTHTFYIDKEQILVHNVGIKVFQSRIKDDK